ncbi:hypothetical protein NL676_019128 [Syzygium grande]|nr:hypothetical protein NL676_019128 [Syzygium grande]
MHVTHLNNRGPSGRAFGRNHPVGLGRVGPSLVETAWGLSTARSASLGLRTWPSGRNSWGLRTGPWSKACWGLDRALAQTVGVLDRLWVKTVGVLDRALGRKAVGSRTGLRSARVETTCGLRFGSNRGLGRLPIPDHEDGGRADARIFGKNLPSSRAELRPLYPILLVVALARFWIFGAWAAVLGGVAPDDRPKRMMVLPLGAGVTSR